MDHHETFAMAIGEKARADRLYMHYALVLAILLTLGGLALVVLGIGDHLDIIIAGRGDLEARFINASPGVALWLIGAFIFWWSRPRKIVGHSKVEALSQPETIQRSERGPFLIKNVGVSPRTGKQIEAYSGRYGPYLVDENVYVALPFELDPNQITLGFASDLLEQKRRLMADIAAEMRVEEGTTILMDFGKSPFHENAIVVLQIEGRRPFLGDGVKHAEIPVDTAPQSLTRYDAIELLMGETAKPLRRSEKRTSPPTVAPLRATAKPVATERQESWIELYQSAPVRRQDEDADD